MEPEELKPSIGERIERLLGGRPMRWVAAKGGYSTAPRLLEAGSRAVLTGESLVHYDVSSDNIYFLEDRTVFLDWTGACRGNPMLDVRDRQLDTLPNSGNETR